MDEAMETWLTNEYLERALNNVNDSNVKVISKEIKSATAAGDNYSSDMYRVKVKYTKNEKLEETTLVIKAARLINNLEQYVAEGNAFDKEVKAFTLILPSLHQLLPKVNQPFSAGYIYSSPDPPTCTIVMEDLKEQGFRMAERRLGLDFKHSVLVMRRIGKYHGASVALYGKEPEKFKSFMESLFREDGKEILDKFLGVTARNFAKEIEKWPGYNEKYGEKIRSLTGNATSLYINAVKRDDSEFNVLCHGDLWLNNMMFRYSQETGDVTDVRFVDYQLGHWTSPAVDLQYFLRTSVSPDLIDKHDELIEEYHKSLEETLSYFGLPQLSFQQLKQQLNKRGLYAVLTSIIILPVVLVNKSEAPDMKKMETEEVNVCFSDVYRTAMKKFLPIFAQKGWL